MSDFTIGIDVNTSQDTVFRYIADGARTPEWYEAVQAAQRISEGATAVGTRYLFTRVLPQQGEVVNEVEVTEFEAPSLVTFTSRTGPTPFVYRYRIEPRGPDASRVTLEGRITGEGLRGAASLLAPVAGKLFERGMGKNLQSLKARLET